MSRGNIEHRHTIPMEDDDIEEFEEGFEEFKENIKTNIKDYIPGCCIIDDDRCDDRCIDIGICGIGTRFYTLMDEYIDYRKHGDLHISLQRVAAYCIMSAQYRKESGDYSL